MTESIPTTVSVPQPVAVPVARSTLIGVGESR